MSSVEAIKKAVENEDRYRAIEIIESKGELNEIAEIYDELVRKFYWDEKDVRTSVFLARAGIGFCLGVVAREKGKREEFLGNAKVMAYNLASFAWDGWDEPGITITECELREGFEAAKLNLRLALTLRRPPAGLHNAYWMLGAH